MAGPVGYTRSIRQSPSGSNDIGRRHKPDHWLVALSAILLAIGVIVVYSIGPALSIARHMPSNYYVVRQLIAIVLSVIVFAITSHVPIEQWKRFARPLLALAACATIVALLMPVNPLYPAHRWIRLGSFSFQSVELLKFAVLVAAAGFLAQAIEQGTIADTKKTLKPLVIAVVIMGIFVAGPQSLHAQSDLGSMGVIIAILTSMCFVAGVPMRRIMIGLAILAIGVVLVILPSAYRRERLLDFMHPEQNCQTTGWQACQGIISVGSGGMIGLGLGRSVQAYGYQPEAANDSIFAIYAEKFGFIGCMVLIGLFVGFFGRLKGIAERAPDDFSRLLVIGVLAWLSVQLFINIGGMVGLLPLKGITLPFISYGGTSVVFIAAAIGLVFEISRYTTHTVPRESAAAGRRLSHDYRRDGRRLRGAYHPDFSRRG